MTDLPNVSCEYVYSRAFIHGLKYCHTVTVLSRFLAHAFLSEHAPLLEYRCTEVYRDICNIIAPAVSINSQNVAFRLKVHAPKSAIIRCLLDEEVKSKSICPPGY